MPDPAVKKTLFILNPFAGIPPVKFIISKELKRRRDELSYYKSLSVDESGTLIRQNFDKYDVFVAAGGDGTVHTVASQLVGTGKLLGVLPIGSGNGFARELGFRPNIRLLLKDIEKKECFNTDVISINNNLCLNVAGVGLDSFVAHSFDKLKTRGFWSYVGVTITNFIRLRPFHVKISIDGEKTISEDLFVLTAANTRQFGNNAYIAPAAVPNDGLLDIIMLKPFPKLLFPIFIFRLFTKRMNRSKYFIHIKTGKEVTISTDETRFHIDGEPVTFSGDVIINVKKDALKVLKTRFNKFSNHPSPDR
jgi:YegS/Rv2252/BmrU family lipid kinase